MNFLLVPFYTSVMQPGRYGIVTEFYAYVAFFNILYTFGMETAYFRYANKDQADEKNVYSIIQSFITILGILFTLTLIFFSSSISESMGYSGKPQYVIWLACVMFIDAFVAIPFARLRFKNRVQFFVIIKLINILLNICFNIFFLVVCAQIHQGKYLSFLQPLINIFYDSSRQVEFVFMSNLLANLIFVPMLIKPLTNGWRFSLRYTEIKPYFNYAYPIMIMGIAGMINEMLSRAMLKYVLPDGFYGSITKLEALGIFGACYKLSMFMTLAVQSFRYAAEPFFFSKAADKNAPDLFAKVMKWFVIFCSAIYLVVSVNLDFFGLLLRKEIYRTGLGVVPLLLLANLFLGIYYNLSVWYKLSDRTQFGAYISLLGACITIVLNLLFIPIAGYMGAAFATLVCYFTMCAMSYYYGNKYYPIQYPLGSIFFYIALATIIIFILSNIYVSFILKCILSVSSVVFYGICVWIFERDELNTILKKKSF